MGKLEPIELYSLALCYSKPGVQRVHYKNSLTFRVRRYVVIATKPVDRLQIRPVVHNYGAPPTIPPTYIPVPAVVW